MTCLLVKESTPLVRFDQALPCLSVWSTESLLAAHEDELPDDWL